MSDEFMKGWITRLLYRRARRELRRAKAEDRQPRRFWLVDQLGGQRWTCVDIVRCWRNAEKDLGETLGRTDFVLQVVIAECDFYSGHWTWSPLYIDLHTQEGQGQAQDDMILYRELEPANLAAEATGPDGIDSMGTIFGVMDYFARRIRASGLKPDSPEGKRHLLAATQYVATGHDPDHRQWVQCQECERYFVLLANEGLVEFFLKNRDWCYVEGEGLRCQDCGGLPCEHICDELPDKWPGRSPVAQNAYRRVLWWDQEACRQRREKKERATYECPSALDLPDLIEEARRGGRRSISAICRYAEKHGPDAVEVVPILAEALLDEDSAGEEGYSLAAIGPTAAPALPNLIAALRRDAARDYVCQPHLTALEALATFAREAVPVVVKVVRGGLGIEETLLAVSFLSKVTPPATEALPLLRELAVPDSETAAWDSEGVIRTAAKEAIRRIETSSK